MPISSSHVNQEKLQNSVHPWTIASTWMIGVTDLLRAQGLDVTALLHEAGIDVRVLKRSDGRVPVEQVNRLWMLAAKHSEQPFIALNVSGMNKPTSFDVLAYAMMSCENLSEAVKRLVQYCAVVSDAVDLRVVPIAEGCRIEVTPMEPSVPGRSLRLDYTIVTFLAFCRWVSCRDIVPLGVELSYPRPNDLAQHQAAFSCTPLFNAACHTLLLRQSDLQHPLPSANVALNLLHETVVQERVKSLRPSGIEDRLAACIALRISSGRVLRQDVANDLCMSERTLQRRLLEAGTSFQKELDTLLCKLAHVYLCDQSIPIKGIAAKLGFAEESTFYRACQRWFHRSPKQVREDASLPQHQRF